MSKFTGFPKTTNGMKVKYQTGIQHDARPASSIKVPVVNGVSNMSLKRMDYAKSGSGNSISRSPSAGKFNRSQKLNTVIMGASNKRRV